MADATCVDRREPQKTRWHQLLAQVVAEPLTSAKISVQTEVDVVHASPKADIILLRRAGNTWTEEQKAWLSDGMRDNNAGEWLIEFKFTESLTEKILKQLLVYDHLYREKQQLKRDDEVYESSQPIFDSLFIILLNELSDTPHNALWKCFASRRQEWQKAFANIGQYCLPSISVEHEFTILGIKKIRTEGTMKNLETSGLTPEYVRDLGRQEFFAAMMDAMSDEELFQFKRPLTIRQVGKQEGRQEGRQEGEAKLLIRQLRHRFGDLPFWAIQKISDADSATLETWGFRVLDAKNLEEMFADPS